MKKSFSLFESFIVLVLISIIFYTVVDLTAFISSTKNEQYNQTKSLIDMESTRIFLEKKLSIDEKLELLNFNGDKLYYNDQILLENVKSFELHLYNNKISYTLCINSYETICQNFNLKE